MVHYINNFKKKWSWRLRRILETRLVICCLASNNVNNMIVLFVFLAFEPFLVVVVRLPRRLLELRLKP